MKKAILLLLILPLFAISCGEDKAAKEAEKLELIKEIETIESVSAKVENLKIDIEKSSKELDALLNDL